MSDVFISYSSLDKSRVEPLVRLIEEQGWSVWWDHNLPVGHMYDDFISNQLDASKCVVVVWTKNSVGSKWVRAEATKGLERNVLVPVLLEQVTVPLAFSLLQAARLYQWGGEPANPEAAKLLARVSEIVGNPQQQPQAQRAVQPPGEVERTEDLRPRDSAGRRRLPAAGLALKTGAVFVSAVVLAFLIWKTLLQPAPPAANVNAPNVVAPKPGKVTVTPVSRSDADVQRVVDALKQQGFNASATERIARTDAPDNPQVRWFYAEDAAKGKEVLDIVNRTLGISAQPNPDPTRAGGHSKGYIRVYLDGKL